MQAMANPLRIAIMRLLARGDLSVTEVLEGLAPLAGIASVERTNVSKHLASLREAGIASVAGDSRRRIYHLEAACLVDALDCVVDGSCSIERAGKKCGKGHCDE